MAEQTGSRSPFSAFGSNKPPKPVVYPWLEKLLGPNSKLGLAGIKSLTTGGAEAERRFTEGTPRADALQGEQEGVLRGLLSKSLGYNALDQLKAVGDQAFSWINPNVVSPLAESDARSYELSRRARGLNDAAVDSTSERLRNARIASGRYYDTARQVYGSLPGLFQNVFNAGQSQDALSRGYLPEIAAGWRNTEMSPLIPAMARADLANQGTNILMNQANAAKAATYGFQQPKNFWDRMGDLDSSLWGRLGEAVQMYGSVMGGGMGGMGGMMGGMGGGGGGGGSFGANSQHPTAFTPQVPQSLAPMAAPSYYNPGMSVSPFGFQSMPPINYDPPAQMINPYANPAYGGATLQPLG